MTDRLTNNRYWKPWVDGPGEWDGLMIYEGEAAISVEQKGRSMWRLVRAAHSGSIDGSECFECSDLGDMRVEKRWYVWIGQDVACSFQEECGGYEYLPDLHDLWDEWGSYCPWWRMSEGTPRAVAFVHIWDAREVAS